MRRYLIFALVAAVVAGAAGCGATAPVKLTEVPKAAKLSKSRERPLRYEVVFAPVVLGQTEKPRGQFAAAVKPDPEKIRSELAGTLKEFKVFDKLETIEAQTEEEAIAKARENGADLLLTTSIDRYNVSYDRGTRGGGAVIAWLFSPWISWFVADEVYSADVGITMTLKKISDGSVIRQLPLTGKATCELDDLQRGLKTHEYLIGSIFTGPNSFNEANYRKAADVVGPHAMQDLQLKMIEEMYQIPQPPPDKRSYALVIGVNRSRMEGLPRLKYAEDDAKAFTETLEKTGSFDEVKILVGEQAMQSSIKDAIDEFASREFEEIVNFVVFFAGPGASSEGKLYLATGESRSIEGLLPLEEFYSMVEKAGAGNPVIILDAGFAGAGSRGLMLTGPAAKFPEEIQKGNVLVISSCEANQGGHEFDDIKHGIFSFLFLEGLKGDVKLDINGDKKMTAEEIVTRLDWEVQRYVRDHTEDQSQKPTLVGDEKLRGRTVIEFK